MNLEIFDAKIKNIVINHANIINEFIKANLPKENHRSYSLVIAGNSLNSRNPNDIDIFPNLEGSLGSSCQLIDIIKEKFSDNCVSNTKNAITIKYKEYTLQFCNYSKPTLKELVESFDFAHIQIGASFIIENSDYNLDSMLVSRVIRLDDTIADTGSLDTGEIENIKLYYTEDYVNAKLSKDSWFIGSEYPLSSLLRLNKYDSRGDISKSRQVMSSLKILERIVDRGFDSYEDFKDQIDAVDLGLLESDFDDANKRILVNLYNKLTKDVNDKRTTIS